MLSPTEAAARNAKVTLRNAEKKLAKLEEMPVPFETRKPATRSPLPKIDPSKRVWKRPPHVAKARVTCKVAIPTQASNLPISYIREYLRGERA